MIYSAMTNRKCFKFLSISKCFEFLSCSFCLPFKELYQINERSNNSSSVRLVFKTDNTRKHQTIVHFNKWQLIYDSRGEINWFFVLFCKIKSFALKMFSYWIGSVLNLDSSVSNGTIVNFSNKLCISLTLSNDSHFKKKCTKFLFEIVFESKYYVVNESSSPS